MADGVGERFQEETKYHPDRMVGGRVDWTAQPEPYKEYPDARLIELPRPSTPAASLDETLRNRRSIRGYSDRPITLDQLSYLLWASDGVRGTEQGYEFRTAPSAGALYPVETYLVVNRVEGAPQGIYHYGIRQHALEELQQGDFGHAAARAALGQAMCAQCAVVFVWTAIFQRSRWKYAQRAYRYVYLDAGHIAENLALAATALGLGTCQVGALFDDQVNELIGADGTGESVLYMSAVGHRSGE